MSNRVETLNWRTMKTRAPLPSLNLRAGRRTPQGKAVWLGAIGRPVGGQRLARRAVGSSGALPAGPRRVSPRAAAAKDEPSCGDLLWGSGAGSPPLLSSAGLFKRLRVPLGGWGWGRPAWGSGGRAAGAQPGLSSSASTMGFKVWRPPRSLGALACRFSQVQRASDASLRPAAGARGPSEASGGEEV